MSDVYYGENLDPERTHRERGGLTGKRQYIRNTCNPSSVNEKEQLLVIFLNLEESDVITPGTACLTFNLTVTNGTPVNNIKSNIIKHVDVKLQGNTVLTIENSDILYSYIEQWTTEELKALNSYKSGLTTTKGMSEACLKQKLGVANSGANDKEKVIAEVYKNRFTIPLNFKLLETAMPFHQASLAGCLSYVLTFNNKEKFIVSSGNNGTYKVDDIMLEYEVIRSQEMADQIRQYYSTDTPIMFDRITMSRSQPLKSSTKSINLNFNSPAKSLRGILVIGKKPDDIEDYGCDSDKYWNLGITGVKVSFEGIPNQIYGEGMIASDIYDEARRFFAGAYKKPRLIDNVVKNLGFADVSPGKFYDDKYALWIDLRKTQDNYLHGSGLNMENISEGLTVRITRKADTGTEFEGTLYSFLFMDGVIKLVETAYGGAVW